jgi:hypothetical protein
MKERTKLQELIRQCFKNVSFCILILVNSREKNLKADKALVYEL